MISLPPPMLPTQVLPLLTSPLGWLPFYLGLTLFVAMRLLSRRRALPLATGLSNSLHVGLATAAWLVPLAGRDYLGWAAVGAVVVTLALLLLERPNTEPVSR